MPSLPRPVVDLLPVVPGLAFVPPVVPAPAPAPPVPPAPPPAPCAKAAEPESINAVAKPIAASFMCCSCRVLAMSGQAADATGVPISAPQRTAAEVADGRLANKVVANEASCQKSLLRKKLLKAWTFRSQVGRSRCSGETPFVNSDKGEPFLYRAYSISIRLCECWKVGAAV